MSFRMVAFHYPKTGHSGELLRQLEQAAQMIKSAPGCVDVELWKEQTSGALVSTARFESREAFMKAFQAAGATTKASEIEERAREVYNLVDP